MRVDFNNYNSNKQQTFGMSCEITDKAVLNLKSRFMTAKDTDRFEKVVKRFDDKGKLIKGTLDEVNGDLVASIFSEGRYYETKTESTFSRLFRGPISFLESWADRADKIEQRILSDIKIEEIAGKH